MEGTAKAHQGEYGVEPEVLVEVPQVTTLLGAFAEYCKGFSLTSTNSHGLRVALTRRDDNTVRVFNATRGERKKFQLSALKERKEDKWASIVKAVCQTMLSAELDITGFDMTFKGQSAVADAPSLTAAIVSGMVYGLNSLYSLSLDANAMMRLGFSVNRFMTRYGSRLRDLVTLFTAEPGKVIFFDLESYDYSSYDYPFVAENGIGSYFIDCSLPEDELSGEVDIFRENCVKAVKMATPSLPMGEKLRSLSSASSPRIRLSRRRDLRR